MLSKSSATLLHPAGATELSMSPWGLWQMLGGPELPYHCPTLQGRLVGERGQPPHSGWIMFLLLNSNFITKPMADPLTASAEGVGL